MNEHLKKQNSGYSEVGASRTRRSMKSFPANSGSAIRDINENNAVLRKRSRLLYASSPIATSAINTNRTKIVGTGLFLKSGIDYETLGMTPEAAKAWQNKAEAEWNLWAKKKTACDALGLNNFYGLQQLALKSWLLSGDVFGLVKRYEATKLEPYTLRIHVIEADRVCTPNINSGSAVYGSTEGENKATNNKIHDGVEVDENGRTVAYHICTGYPNEALSDKLSWIRVEAVGKNTGLPNIVHVMDSERPDQYRGVPYLAQVIEQILQVRRYTESELTAALIQSFFTAWIETETDPSDLPFNEVGDGSGNISESINPTRNISDDMNEYEMGPGTVNVLKPGEKINFGNPNIPTAGFDTFIKTFCRMIGAALEMPYDVLIKEFNSSYSASRAALMEAWEAIKMRRTWFVDSFCQPIYEMWLSEAVALGRIKAPGFFDDPLIRSAWCGARWIGPVQGSLDPKKEAEANILLVQQGFKTRSQVTREIGGGDWEDNAAELENENKLLSVATPAPQNSNNNDDDDDRKEGDEQ